jgi:hypothetical protein
MPRPIYKYALAILSLAAIVSGSVCAQTTDADALYQRALARLHSLPQHPYIEYTMSQSNGTPDSDARSQLVEIVVERRADRTSWNAVQGDDAKLVGVLIGRHYLIPDAFLTAGPSGATPPPATEDTGAGALPQLDDAVSPSATTLPLKTIATVGTRPSHRYNVNQTGVEHVANCGNAAHIFLHPTGDPEFNNVRELWIRTSDAMLCKARYNSKLFDVRHTQTANTLDITATLNEEGLVVSWQSTGHIFLPPPGFATVGDGTFTRYVWKENEPDFLFDEKLWNAHANQVKASLKASPSP